MKKKLLISAIFASLIATTAGQSFAHETGEKHRFVLDDHKGFVEFGAPEKGAANARILVDGETMLMEILTPAYNIHGVEAAPVTRTKEQKEQVAKASRAFMDAPQRYFSFTPIQACQMEGLAYRREQVELRADQSQPQNNTRWQYYNVRSELFFNCPDGAPQQMNVELFAAFPRLETIHVQLIENGQDLRRIKLTKNTPVIEFTQFVEEMDKDAPNKNRPQETLKDKPEEMHAGEKAEEAPKNVK